MKNTARLRNGRRRTVQPGRESSAISWHAFRRRYIAEGAVMALETITGLDLRVRDHVMQQLEEDPRVNAEAIGVTAADGAVTLTGFIDSYEGKLAAERAAKRVRGVRAVANDIQVKLRLPRTDADIAHDAARALRLRASLPEHVQAAVHDGHITLTGRVSWCFQRDVAEEAVRSLAGVVS